MQESTTAQSSRQSFIDTLTSVSSTPVQKAGATHSEERRSAEECSINSVHNQDQNSNSSSIQSKKNQEPMNRDQQGESVSPPAQQAYSKTDHSAVKTSPEKSSENKGVRKSDGSSSKKAGFAVQVASPFILQSSTAQPELNGLSLVAATVAGTDGLAAKADSQEQVVDAQSGISVAGQGSGQQTQANVSGLSSDLSVPDSLAGQGNDAEGASDLFRASRSVADDFAGHLTSLDPASQEKSQAIEAALQSTANIANDSCSVSTPDPASSLQASLEAKNQMESTTGPGDGHLIQPIAKAIQLKESGSALELDSEAMDSSKTARSEDTQNDRSSAHAAGVASVQILSTQTGGAYGSAVEARGSDASLLQQGVDSTQTESRGTTDAHTNSGSTETTAHRGNGFEGLTSKQLAGSESAGMSGISAARLIQTVGASEMRVGMHSSEFGDISIRTSVSQQQMQTQISVDHNELGKALSAHIPNMQAKLGSEYGLHATIEVNQSGTSFSSDGDRSQQHPQRTSVRPVELVDGAATGQDEMISLRGSTVASDSYRLDIRA